MLYLRLMFASFGRRMTRGLCAGSNEVRVGTKRSMDGYIIGSGPPGVTRELNDVKPGVRSDGGIPLLNCNYAPCERENVCPFPDQRVVAGSSADPREAFAAVRMPPIVHVK